MKAIKFPEVTHMIAENQDEYITLPAFVSDSPQGEVVFCMKLSFKERLKLLFTGQLWCSLMMFGKPVTPIYFTVTKSDILETT